MQEQGLLTICDWSDIDATVGTQHPQDLDPLTSLTNKDFVFRSCEERESEVADYGVGQKTSLLALCERSPLGKTERASHFDSQERSGVQSRKMMVVNYVYRV